MGMRSEDFWNDTPQEFYLRLEGHREKEKHDYRDQWERARLTAYYAIAAHIKKGKGMKQMIPLPWDNEHIADRPTLAPEEVEDILKRFEKTLPGWRGRQLATS